MLRCQLFLTCLILCSTLIAAGGQAPAPAKDLHGDPLPAFATARLGTLRWRHDDVVRFAAFLPDGKSVLSVGGDQTIRLWEFPSGKEIRRIMVNAEGKLNPLAGLGGAFLPKTQFAAALSTDGKIVATYFDSPVRGSKKADKPQIYLHEVGTGKELPALTAGGLDVTTLAFSPQGEHLMSADFDGTVRIWDYAKAKEVRSFQAPSKADTGPGLTLSGPAGGLPAPDASVYAPDGNTLMFLKGTNALRLVDVRTGQEIGPTGHTMPVKSAQFTLDGKQVVTQADDSTTNRWDAVTGKDLGPILKRPGQASPLKALLRDTQALSPDGTILVDLQNAALKDQLLMLADAATGKEVSRIALNRPGPLSQSTLLFSPGNKLLAVLIYSVLPRSNDDQRIELYNVATGKRLHMLTDKAVQQPAANVLGSRVEQTVAFSPDGQMLAWSIGQNIVLWSTTTGERIGALPTPNGAPLRNVAFTPDDRCLALDMSDGTVVLYELATAGPRRVFGKELAKKEGKAALKLPGLAGALKFQMQPANHMAISPDGKLMALAGEDRKIYVWDNATGRELAAFKGHVGKLNAVAFSPDSQRIASASADTTALVWDCSKLDRSGPAPKVLKPGELEQCWQTLADSDGTKAFAAMCDLTASPAQAVAFIKDMVKPAAPADVKAIEALIVQLEDDLFKVRDKAATELSKIGEPIIPSLDKALAGNLTLESKRRVEELRNRLTGRVLQSDRLRVYRAVEVLERIGTPESRQELEALAAGAPGTLLTTSAQAALKR